MQDVKMILRSYIPAQRYAEKCFRELKSVREASVKSQYFDGVHISRNIHGLENQIIRIEQAREKAEREQERTKKALLDIEDMIESLEDYTQKAIIKMRYLYGYEWEDIAISLDLSRRTVLYAHANALTKLQAKMPVMRSDDEDP